ncbi:hypothetical protein [Sandaracinus amylolyticus]|uniref:hypothetical protein n=1 Tax=Sandaracinus amylolyticus TaxID=927083 RepID=UPI001F34DA64|nr:hypothetical protein [Sandaracinus amylolyticus]UJR79054.1 Hypothetical protein I5071_10870 [Sandaracinus amylolyticus]
MPRKLRAQETLDTIEDEILFTRAAVEADPDAADLLPMTDSWLALVDATRAADRAARIAGTSASALRIVANGRLDDACTRFGRTLAIDTPTTSPRWRRFFSTAISSWIDQRLVAQVATVRGWLTITDEPVLEAHRAPLAQWSESAQVALDRTAASAQTRGAAQIARESLAEDLTRERDGLYAALLQRAGERSLARDWAARFFRVERRRGDPDAEPEGPQGPAA